ncbi:MAG: diguanylate cyclase [Nitrospirota bacterium]|nr:diguanylate cyclase [Nitrospirota bacterium]
MAFTLRSRDLVTRIINFLTFVDLPIRKKFVLFGIGVLFWFVILFAMIVWTLVDINTRMDDIARSYVPQNRTAEKIGLKVNEVRADALEVLGAPNVRAALARTAIAMKRLDDIASFLVVLEQGGQISDFQRDDDALLDSYLVRAAARGSKVNELIRSLREAVKKTRESFVLFADSRTGALSGRPVPPGQTGRTLGELKAGLARCSALAVELAAVTGQLSAGAADRIKFSIRCTSWTSLIVMAIAFSLLVLFTFWISRSIAVPVNSMIEQVRALGEGGIGDRKRIEIDSKDEIGQLSNDFNLLMEEIREMAAFKKVIEEDESVEDVYSRLGRTFSESLGFKNYLIYEVSNSQNKMAAAYPLVREGDGIFCNPEILDQCDLCRAKKTGHVISSIDYPGICKQFRGDINKDHVCTPMIIGGSTGGVVQFLFERDGEGMSNRSRRLFKARQFINESVSVLEAKRLMNTLRESALKDSLTGLYNRRFLQEYTDTLVSGNARRGKSLGLIMCDLDYFKQVNDVYGHAVGDTVLKETSDILKSAARSSDLVIRFGGEEFLIILLDVNEGDSLKVAEKIRQSVEQTKIRVPDGILKKTISMGVSEFPTDTSGFWQAIKYADVALYQAKESGRNRCVRFKPEMWKEEQF